MVQSSFDNQTGGGGAWYPIPSCAAYGSSRRSFLFTAVHRDDDACPRSPCFLPYSSLVSRSSPPPRVKAWKSSHFSCCFVVRGYSISIPGERQRSIREPRGKAGRATAVHLKDCLSSAKGMTLLYLDNHVNWSSIVETVVLQLDPYITSLLR